MQKFWILDESAHLKYFRKKNFVAEYSPVWTRGPEPQFCMLGINNDKSVSLVWAENTISQ